MFIIIRSSLSKRVLKKKVWRRKSRRQICEKTLAREYVLAVSTFPWLPCGSHTTLAVDNAERTGLNSVTQKQQRLRLISTLRLMWETVLTKLRGEKRCYCNFYFKMCLTFEATVLSSRFVLVWGLFPSAFARDLLKPSESWEQFMLPLMIGDASSPDICYWNPSVRLTLCVK